MQWLARGEVELPVDHGWMSEREHRQAASIRFTKRRQEYLTRRWASKHAIAATLELAQPGVPVPAGTLRRIEVRNHPSGAPWVAVDGEAADIEMSLTDRAGWAVCLVGADPGVGRLGIDLEITEPRSPGFVRDYLTEPEQRFVGVAGSDLRDGSESVEIGRHRRDGDDGPVALLQRRQAADRPTDEEVGDGAHGSLNATDVKSGWQVGAKRRAGPCGRSCIDDAEDDEHRRRQTRQDKANEEHEDG